MNRISCDAVRVLFVGMLVLSLCLPAYADSVTGSVATSDDYGGREALSAAGMTKVSGDQIADGSYSIIAQTDSQMFNIVDCQLTVKDGVMTAVVTLSSDGYQWLYMGTGQQATAASQSEYISYVKDAQGDYTYSIGQIAALNSDISCCSYSKRRDRWYDHTIILVAASLPASALSADAQKAVRESGPIKDLKDGAYTITADVSGGNDELTSPAPLTVKDGEATVKLEFGSADYRTITMAGQAYEADTTTGKSVFELPATVFDTAVPVTIASTQKNFATTISLHSGQIESAGGQGLPIAGIVVVCIATAIALAVIIIMRKRTGEGGQTRK